ncbi:MAG: DUF1549 domain-containing protein [Planctomycetaceae bacterium]
MVRSLPAGLFLSCLFTIALTAAELPPAAEQEIDFARDIKPIFAKHCLQCHGPDAQEGGFRVDVKQNALDGGDTGKVILPKESHISPLIERVAAVDPELMMPPEGEDLLTKEQVGLLRAWIDQGAIWPDTESAKVEVDHWAFKPITRPEVPAVTHQDWVKNEIDHFVLSKLESKELTPSPEADRYTLIRRLYLDLIGLAPTPEEIDAFVNDESPEAYEKIVDHLLASPHFGERWGRHWLDMARYADSDGYEKDNPRPNAWRYRDWVINAVNEDMPYDQFTREQLAGDLIDNASKMQQLATAFHRQTLTNTEGGTDQEQWRVEAVFDRVETTGAIWLGLTVGCARCHSHKYDPIAQREYYQLFAYFNNGDETTTDVVKSEAAVQEYEKNKADFDQKVSSLESELKAAKESSAAQQTEWEAAIHQKIAAESNNPLQYHPLANETIIAPEEDTFDKLEDGSWLAKTRRAEQGQYKITANSAVTDKPVVAVRLEAIADDSLPGKGPGLAGYGNFVLSEFRLLRNINGQPTPLQISSVTADHNQEGYHVNASIDGKADTGWAIKPEYGKSHQATYVLAEPITLTADEQISIELDQNYGTNHILGRFKLTLVTGTLPIAH